MAYKRYKICTKVEPKKEGGKAWWPEVGTLWERDGKMSIDLNMFPDVKFYVFEPKPQQQDLPSNVENVPF